MKKWIATAAMGLFAVACSTGQTTTTTDRMGTVGARQERTLVRQNATPTPVWVDNIGIFQKANADMIYGSGGVQDVRDREDGKRDAEMLAKRQLGEMLGQRIVSLYLTGRSGERNAEIDESAKVIREALGASADNVLVGARPLQYYWEEWNVPQQNGPSQIRYQVYTLVGLDRDAVKQVAANMAARAADRLRREHRAEAANMVDQMSSRLASDPDATRNIMAGFGG